MGRGVVVCVVLAACGRGGFDSLDGSIADGSGSATSGWIALASGYAHTCGVRTDGTLACWGRNDSGQLGLADPIPAEVDTPTTVDTATWQAVAVSEDDTCAIRTDASLWCWGYNYYGQVGDGTTMDRHTPVQVAGTWTTVAVGLRHTCAIDTSSSLFCWGTELDGEIGDGAESNTQVAPVAISSGWISVTAGDEHTCALATDRSLWCWGYGPLNGLGGANELTPARVGTDTWLAVVAGPQHTCGVRSDGRLRCWGNNSFGELGDGTTSSSNVPIVVGQDQIVDGTSVGANGNHSCAIRSDNTLWCWGDNQYGELATDTSPFSFQSTPIQAPSALATAVTLGQHNTCVIGPDQHAYCAGVVGTSQRLPVQVPGTWTRGAAGSFATCAIDAAQALQCWGDNSFGLLGDGTQVARDHPAPISGSGTWQAVALGDHACGIDTANQLYCWGRGDVGQIGNGAAAPVDTTPVHIGTSAFIAATSTHSCSVDAGNTLACWGQNADGQSGTDPAVNGFVTAPTSLAGTWTAVGVAAFHSCAIDSASRVQCWGNDGYGQLGDGNNVSRYTPAPVANAGTFVELVLGGYHGCARDSSNQWWCWGGNEHGELGDQTVTPQSTPEKLLAPASPLSVSTGDTHTCAVAGDRALWCWGDNSYGQLGDGSLLDRHQPTRVGTDTSWSGVFAGYLHTCATKTDATLWCWGRDLDGEVGDGTAFRHAFSAVE